MNEPIEPNAKVLFRMPNEDGTAEVETLWATPLGDDKYKLDNSPFYAYSVSWQDIVYAPFSTEEGLPTFERVCPNQAIELSASCSSLQSKSGMNLIKL